MITKPKTTEVILTWLAQAMIIHGFFNIGSFMRWLPEGENPWAYLTAGAIFMGCGSISWALILFSQKAEKAINTRHYDSNSQ